MMGAASVVAAGKRASQKAGVLDGKGLGSLFSLLRPNDLVWNYWVNNNLMGETPPAFDVLAWNADSTRMPAALHTDFLDLFEDNLLTIPGAMTVRGTPIDLSMITQDAYVVGAQNDHLTPWRGCYATTQLLGGKTEFVLSSSGHIQSLVNPPGNPKMRLFTGPEPGADPDAWLAEAQPREGSWWEHWADWIEARSHEQKPAPKKLGNTRHPTLTPAPGTYVHAP
jgi:polyhydroxyalkanoate synthase